MNAFFYTRINQKQRVAYLLGVLGLLACGIGAVFDTRQFFISYLTSILFWLGLSLGCLCVAMIHHLTGGRWGDVTRRFLEAAYMILPLLAVMFIPLFFGLHYLYPWARPDEVAHNEILRHKSHYLNGAGFMVRAAFYFAIWIVMATFLRRWSVQQDKTSNLEPTRMARTLSGPGIVLYTLTVTFAWIDWSMSIEPDWSSTMYPIIVCSSQILCAFAFAILMLAQFRMESPFKEVVDKGHFLQLGNFLLTFVMFWTYVSFGQLLIIWSGNLPHEISWYLHRIAGGWKWIACFLALFNFFLPFFLLLFRNSKRSLSALCLLAGLVFTCQMINTHWTIVPSFFTHGIHVHWMDVAAFCGVGGIWFGAFACALKRAAALTQNDPRISYSFAHA